MTRQPTSDIELSRLSFKLEGDFTDSAKLKSLALEVFRSLNLIAYGRFEQQNLSLRVHLEEGSLNGLVSVEGSAEEVYALISRYSTFAEAVAEMSKDGNIVADEVMKESPLEKIAKDSKKPFVNKSAGAFTKIEKIIQEVKYRKRTKEQGETDTIDLLGGVDLVPNELREAVHKLYSGLRIIGDQTSIHVEAIEREEFPRSKKKKIASSEQRDHWVVDVISRRKNVEPTIHMEKK